MHEHERHVAFVGLGRMGLPMARRLVAAGYRVAGYDRSEEARGRATSAGIRVCDRLADAVTGATVLATMLPGSAAVSEVLDTRGLLASTAPGALVIDLSSSEPMRTRELAETARAAGRRM